MGGRWRMGWLGKNARRFLVGSAVTMTIGLAAGCGGDDDSNAKDKSDGGGAVKGNLHVWMFQPDEGPNWWPGFVKEFEAKHPGAKVQITYYSSEDYYTKLQSAMSAGDEPDIYGSNAGEILNRYARAGKLGAINDIVDLDYWSPASLAAVTSEDKTYAAPQFSSLMVLWQNKDLLKKHGIASPGTWDALLEACGTLSSEGVIPIALGTRAADAWTAGVLFDTLLYQQGGPTASQDATFARNGASWGDDAFVQAATRLKELVDAKCFPDGFTGLNYAQMGALFSSGKAAMTFDGSWLTGSLLESGFTAEPGPLPDAPGAANSSASLEGIVGGEDALTVTAKGVKDFGAALDEYANFYGYLSVAADPKPPTDPLPAKLTEILSSAKSVVTDTPSSVPAGFKDSYLQQIQALAAGSISPAEFGEAMAKAAEQASSETSE